jgi:hypothetical protein
VGVELINKLILQSKWTDQQLKDAMDVVERGHTSLRKAA